jgi:hypothetical protein
MTAADMRARTLRGAAQPQTFPNRVQVRDANNAQRTLNGKFAGGLPSPAHQGREGTWVGYASENSSLVWLDGDDAPVAIKGSALIILS